LVVSTATRELMMIDDANTMIRSNRGGRVWRVAILVGEESVAVMDRGPWRRDDLVPERMQSAHTER